MDTGGTGNIAVRYTVPSWGTPGIPSCSRTGEIMVRWVGPQVGENILVTQQDQYCKAP